MENTLTSSINTKGSFVSILDESLFTGEQKQYQVLCSVDPEFISVAAFDPVKNKFSGFEGFHLQKPHSDEQLSQKISELTQQSSILKKIDFKNVSVQFAGNRFTFIPGALFKPADAESYFYFNQPKRADETIYYNVIRGMDAINIYSVSDRLMDACKKLFENFSTHHHLTSLIDAARFHAQKQSGKSMFVHVHSSMMDVIVMEERKLLFANSFPVKVPEDGIYFVMMVCEQLSLNPEKSEVILSGEIETESALPSELKKYLRYVSFGSRIRTTGFTYGFDELPAHYYHASFSHVLCVS